MPYAQHLRPLIDQRAAFEASLRDLARALVARVFTAELARRDAADQRERTRAPARATTRARERAVAATDDAASATTAATDVTDVTGPSPTRTAGGPPRRGPWSRQQVIDELSSWLLGGNPVEAAFLVRQGHRALVASAKRHFGRFEAALNAANLHLANLHPEGIPSKKKAAGG
jgi:hypothetical protein